MQKNLKKEVRIRIATLLIAAFSLVAAFAWNEAIKTLFKTLLGEYSNLIALFSYAIAVTIIAVILGLKLSKYTKR